MSTYDLKQLGKAAGFTAETTLYTVPANKKALIREVAMRVPDGHTVIGKLAGIDLLEHANASGSTKPYVDNLYTMLAAGDTVTVRRTAGLGTIDAIVSGVEIT